MQSSDTEEQLRKTLYSVTNGGMIPASTLTLQHSNGDIPILIGHSLLNNQPTLLEQGGLVQNLNLYSSNLNELRNANSISNSLQNLPLVSNPFSLDQDLSKIIIQVIVLNNSFFDW